MSSSCDRLYATHAQYFGTTLLTRELSLLWLRYHRVSYFHRLSEKSFVEGKNQCHCVDKHLLINKLDDKFSVPSWTALVRKGFFADLCPGFLHKENDFSTIINETQPPPSPPPTTTTTTTRTIRITEQSFSHFTYGKEGGVAILSPPDQRSKTRKKEIKLKNELIVNGLELHSKFCTKPSQKRQRVK